MPQIVAFAGPAGPAFSFSAFLLPVCSPSCVEGLAFSHPGSPLFWIRSQLGHTGPTGPVWGFAGVVSLSCPQTGQKSSHRGEFGFSPQNELTPPPKGGGAGYRLSWVGPARSQLGHAGPTGLVWGFAGVTPLSGLQNRTQGHTGPNLVSPPFSLSLSRWQPRKLALQVVIQRIVNGEDCVKQRPVSRGAVQCPHRCRKGFDEILVL